VTPLVIIGGGPAGSAAAIRLARAGHTPLLIERSAAPADKVCGDFLGVDALRLLHDLGVDAFRLGAAPIERLRLIHRGRMTEVALPFAAAGLSRRVLDRALLDRAADEGASVRTGQAVRRIARAGDAWQVETGAESPITTSGVFLATGKHDLRCHPRPGVSAGAVGLKMYLRLAPDQAAALGGAIELTLFPGGYAGLQMVEGGQAALCLAVTRHALRAAGGSWSGLMAALTAATPLLRSRLAGAESRWAKPLAVAGVPYGFLHRAVRGDDGALFRVGDQAAVIPSLTGDGIAIALHTGSAAARVWQAGGDAADHHQGLATHLGGQMRLATWLHKAAMAAPLQAAAIRAAAWCPALPVQAARATRVREAFA
jgi:flavin-dependent dehydrogenase